MTRVGMVQPWVARPEALRRACHPTFAIVLLAVGLAVVPVAPSLAQGTGLRAKIEQARQELEPRLITLAPGAYAVDDVLAQLAKQTGNVVLDRRKRRDGVKLELALDRVSFWQALEQLCRQAGCGFTAYADGGIALVDAPLRGKQVHGHGIVRTAVKRLGLTRDEEVAATYCTVALEVAWEPRFQPFYLGVGPVQATFAPHGPGAALTAKTPARGQVFVAGRSALEIDARLDAPPRASPGIAKLEGTLKFIGPSKMLTLTLPELKAEAALTQDEVGIRVTKLRQGPDRWIVELQIDNPEGTPEFESYQTWLDNNRVQLVQGPPEKTIVWRPEPNEAVLLETPRRAVIQYAFGDVAGKGKPGDWSLVVRTPGRIVEITVSFAFQDVALP